MTEEKSRQARKKNKKNKKKINWKKVFLSLLIIAIVGFIAVAGMLYSYIKDAPDISADQLQNPVPTTLLDRNGDHLADIGGENRSEIEFDEISQILEDAVLATEDVRFYEHSGIDLRRIGGAVVANITDGFGSQGASTITQQVVKNAFLSTDKQMERKVQEQYMAFQLERQYSKEQILTMYLNTIYYANGLYGVQRASEVYFGKDNLEDLTLAEAALLAGIPQRPSAHDPINNPEYAENRRNTVLDLMVHHEKITQQEADEAKEIPVPDMIQGDFSSEVPYGSFIDRVEREAEDLIDDDDMDVFSLGLTIHTTLDPSAQEEVERLLSSESPINYPDDELEAGVVAVDTSTGEILAIGGGRNKIEGVGTGFNYALNRTGRQPGSTIKPILDYGPAIEQNEWSTYHQIHDEPYEYADGVQLSNAGRGFFGWVSMREALALSLNVPAVKTFQELDKNHASDFTRDLGISLDGTAGDSYSIGGGEMSTNPLEMAGAYAAFGNEGVYNEPHAIRQIEFRDGSTMEVDIESDPVMNDYTAYMITDMLKDAATAEGTGRNINVGNLPVAGKTGTSNRDDDTPDSWFVGYTTNFTVSIWTGYPQNENITDTQVPQHIFNGVMNHLSEGVETSDFTRPDSVVEVEVEDGTNPAQLPSEYTPSDQRVTELFVRGTEPTEESEEFDVIDPATSLNLELDEEEQTIDVNWDHPGSDDEDTSIAFELMVTDSGGNEQSLQSSTDTSYTFTNVELGETYTFEVVAFDEDNSENRSEPISNSIEVPEEDSSFWDEFFGRDEEDDEDEEEEEESEEDSEEEQEESEEDGNEEEDEGNGNNEDNEGNNGNNEDEDSSEEENDENQEDENDSEPEEDEDNEEDSDDSES
ncbi:PBP1A family penicillin-binding protein [Halalkalibacillus halophilus]|uniref:PBP1A family penicillin-binding protein n=1 Tax=Halalkalibacillus halophilus TaxID=392827 RepID=UPI000408E264|nr:PBP1A family penicillin-binding protein [Halalkalibacillus halophilus]